MEVALPDPPLRRGTPLPLNQLVEESRNRGSVPHHLLESRIYAKLKSNSLIEAEPSEVHFSGFEVGKDYMKTLKLINISSEVMNIHIIPTQTSHFNTTYTKKCRLIPGLAYTVTVTFCPEEWRYFYDCVRVHCQGEENLLIPVHAYPVIDDLHIPPRIDLSAVPLGRRVQHVIPLRCSCPVDFEFQVYVLQSHAAFSIHPLAGRIPACGETKITVDFCPVQYETCQVTIQLVVSQFNTRPYLCTISGNSTPELAFSRLESMWHSAESIGPPPHPRSKIKHRSTRAADKSKLTLRDEVAVRSELKPLVDVCTPAGVAKVLIKDSNKMFSDDLKEGILKQKVKKDLFTKMVQENMKEQANPLRWKAAIGMRQDKEMIAQGWRDINVSRQGVKGMVSQQHFNGQVHLGMEPMTERERRQILEKREIARHDYTVRSRAPSHEEDAAVGQAKLFCTRVVREAGQAPVGKPSFQFYTDFHWELRERPLKLFQQAARKVVIQCRLNRRLACLREVKSPSSSWKENQSLEISPDKGFPSTFPIFTSEDDPLQASGNLAVLPVDPVEVTVSMPVPFFKLQVPQRYKLMNYQNVSTWEAFTSYIPTTPARTLRTAAEDISMSSKAKATSLGTSVEHMEAKDSPRLSFTAPEALLRPIAANPLRIFNPAPGLQTYKPIPRYLENDLEFHLCPVPRHKRAGSNSHGMRTQTQPTQKKLPVHQEMSPEAMTWKHFNSLSALSSLQVLNRKSHRVRSTIDYGTDVLPLAAPLPIAALPDDPTLLMDSGTESPGVQLSPDMIRAQFLPGEAPVSNGNISTETTARLERARQPVESPWSKFNQMGRSTMARLMRLDSAVSLRSAHEESNVPHVTH